MYVYLGKLNHKNFSYLFEFFYTWIYFLLQDVFCLIKNTNGIKNT